MSSSASRKSACRCRQREGLRADRTPVLWRTAEAMATGKAMVSAMAMASSASCRLGRMRRRTFSRTGSPVADRAAEIAAQEPAIHAAYCTAIAAVEPQLAAGQALLRARVRRFRHHGVDRIARREGSSGEHARPGRGAERGRGEQPRRTTSATRLGSASCRRGSPRSPARAG